MKKFFVILVLLVIFVTCAVFGFSSARSTWKTISDSPARTSAATTSNPHDGQHNILVIRVNDLESSNPVLLSAWIFFITYSDPPNMTMKILFPSSKPDTLSGSFSIDRNGRLSSRFEKEVEKLNFPWDGYLIMDDQGFQKFSEWILNQPVAIAPHDIRNPPDGFEVFVYDSRQLTALCQNLQGASQRQNMLQWREIVPSHFRSNLAFENLILFWDYLTQSGNPPYCEVIPWG
jgi:hypothetical protein